MNEQTPPDETGVAPADSHSTKVPVDPALTHRALDSIKAAVQGNGFDPDKVSLKSFDGEVIKFSAVTELELRRKITEKTVAGKINGPRAVDSPAALLQVIEQEYNKFSQSPDIARKLHDVISKREDKGFAQDGIAIDLNFWHEDFVVYEPCGSCRGKGEIQCKRCHGLGHEPCPQCRQKGVTPCPQCKGAQFVQGQNGQQQCPQCKGQGDVTCTLCRQRGQIQCKICRTKGSTQCKQCNGHAWNSKVTRIEMEALTHFRYARDQVPDKAAAMVERLGPKLGQHARIEILPPKEDAAEQPGEAQEAQDGGKNISLHYVVEVPQGDITFSIGKRNVDAFLFGERGKLLSLPPFLEKLMESGIGGLKEAAAARGDVAANLQEAARFRTLKDAILLAARFPLDKAVKGVRAKTPLGLSAKTIEAVVIDADRALKNITRKPRRVGLAGGLVLAAVLYAGYFFGGGRGAVTSMVPNASLHPALDLLAAGAGAMLTLFVIQIAGFGAMRKALKGIVPPGKERAIMPKAGMTGLHAGLGSFAIFGAMWAFTVL